MALARGRGRATAVPDVKVLLESERVRVQFHDVKAREKTPLHSHPSYVAYGFSPYKARFVLADGAAGAAERRAGDLLFGGPVGHSVENIGNAPVHSLIVELKGGEAARSRPLERTAEAEGPPPAGSYLKT